MERYCDGTDHNLIGADGRSPCGCGRVFDDVDHEVIWPHRHFASPAQRQAIIDAMFAAHADCPATCDIARIGRLEL